LNKQIERLAFIGCRLIGSPEFDIGYVLEKDAVRTTRPNSRKAKYNLFLREYAASRCRTVDGPQIAVHLAAAIKIRGAM
jgi:hypothetical protein